MYFSIFMVVILLVTGLIWWLDIALLRKNRASGSADPWYVEYAKSFFPVILVVFIIRSFIVEPFKIPSGSMMPTLLAGDYILVNKFTYGLRLPILNNRIISINDPKRGDVFVFHFPEDVTTDYIKRVVGLPGDVISYHDKQLSINGQAIAYDNAKEYVSFEQPQGLDGKPDKSALPDTIKSQNIREDLMGVKHQVLTRDDREAREGDWTVPAGHYFAMGDNRDNSNDSRYWGFVPERNLVGKAFFIWLNFDEFGRIGTTIN